MLQKQPPQLPLSQAEPVCKLVHAGAFSVQCAFGDQRQSPRNRIRCAAPRRQIGSGLWTASQTGTESRILRGSRGAVKNTVLKFRSARRTHRPAIDPRRPDSNEDQPVKSRVPALQRPIARLCTRQFHASIFASQRWKTSGFRTLSFLITWRRFSKRWFFIILLWPGVPSLRSKGGNHRSFVIIMSG